MPSQPSFYRQTLFTNDDTGPNQWAVNPGPNHWAAIDDPIGAPNTADYIAARTATMGGKIERFGFTLPNHENLEGGFDWVYFRFYAWYAVGLLAGPVKLNLNLYVKGVWQGAQGVVVNGQGVANIAWYGVIWSVYCCDRNDADSIQVEIEVNPAAYVAQDGVFVAATYLYINGQAILSTADAKKSSFI